MADPVEVELKYRVLDQAALERLLDTEWLGEQATGSWRTVDLEDRYLDTADGALARAGFAARLRREGEATMLTLKSRTHGEGRGGALFRRSELEAPAGEGLDPAAWPASEARRRLVQLAGEAPLRVRFTLRQLRRERELRGSDGWAILSLDEVHVLAADRELGGGTFLELEARGGSERLLEDVAALLEASGTVTPEGRSKEVLAAELLAAHRPAAAVRPWAPATGSPASDGDGRQPGGAIPAPATDQPNPAAPTLRSEDPLELETVPGLEVALEPEASSELKVASELEAVEPEVAPEPGPSGPSAEPVEPVGRVEPAGPARRPHARHRLEAGKSPGVLAGDPLAEAGRKVLRFNFARLLAREAGTREGKDPEELHAMRVATRRMRAAWRVFGDAYRRGRRRRYVAELKAVADALGAVRDRDVLIDALREYIASLTSAEAEAMAPLLGAWQEAREAARAELLARLDGDVYRRFLEDYEEFVTTAGAGAAAVPATQPHRVRDTAPSRVWSAYEQLRAYDTALGWADIPTLHALRIAGKRLRYTLEFFREVLGPDTPALIARVTALQDHLGALHDADVAAHLVREFLAGSAAGLSPESIQAAGRYLASREREVTRLRRVLPAAWRPIVSEPFRRALGRAVSVL